jgi:hypothetical protein
MITRAAFAGLLAALVCAIPARADDRVMCQQGAAVASRFVRNTSGFPVQVEVILPGMPAFIITATKPLPAGAKCPATGAITFLADASTDHGLSFHRVMSHTNLAANGNWTVDIAPDSFNGNFALTAQFAIAVTGTH